MEERKSIAVRSELNKSLKEEFDLIHTTIMMNLNQGKGIEVSSCVDLLKIQISLADQIVREERSLKGEVGYAFPPYMTS